MRVIFIASGAFAIPTLRWLRSSGHEVASVVSQPPRPGGRGLRVTRTPVLVEAELLGLPTLPVEDVNAPEVVQRLRSLEARVGIVIAFGQKLGASVLDSTRGGFINLHASLLPKYRGAAPINWAMIRGETHTGCTVFRVNERMDAGAVLTTCRTPIDHGETAGELHDRLAVLGVDAVREALELFSGEANPEGATQNDADATRAPKLKKEDGHIVFDRDAASIVRHIHGVTPWPGARVRFEAQDGRWENVTLTRAQVVESEKALPDPPGMLNDRGQVATLRGCVEILQLQPSSGRVMAWKDYVNGRAVRAGDRFVTPKADCG